MRFWLVIVLIFILYITGCAVHNVSESYSLDNTNKKGVIVGSVTKSKSEKGYQGLSAAVANISIYYKAIGSDTKSQIEFDPSIFYGGDFEDSEGEIFVVELEPGKYEFYSWFLVQGTYTYITPKKAFSVPFEVKQGTATYIGELNMDVIYGANFIGMGVVSGVDLRRKDSYERDILVLKKNYPNFDISSLERKSII